MSNLTDRNPTMMSDKEVRREMAELLGMEVMITGDGKYWYDISGGGIGPSRFPNWPQNIEPMMKLQEHLPKELRPAYMVHLLENIYGPARETYISDMYWAIVHATARQRCEAFILTMRQGQ